MDGGRRHAAQRQAPAAGAAQDEAAREDALAGPRGRSRRDAPPGTSPAPPYRVLVAERDENARAELRQALARDPRLEICCEFCDAPAALAVCLRGLPDLCLLDVSLPGGGLEAALEIRSRLPTTRVVFRTDAYDDPELYACLQAGASGYLRRDVDGARLPEILVRVMAGEAAIPRVLVAHVFEGLRSGALRRRVLVAPGGVALSSREWEVYDLLCDGCTTTEIAEALQVSKATVRSHVASLLHKLGVPDRAAALATCGRGRPGR